MTDTTPALARDFDPPPDTELQHISRELWPLAFPISKLELLPGNYRQGDVGMVSSSIDTFGQRKPIVVNRRTGHVEAGNTTLKAVMALGYEWVAAVLVDDDPTRQSGFAVADNRASALGWDDPRLLGDMLMSIREADEELIARIGYDDADLADLIAQAGNTELHYPDDGVAERKTVDTEGRAQDFGRKPNELIADYEAKGVRSIVCPYPLEQFAWVTGQLAELRKRTGYADNSELLLWLVQETIGQAAPGLEPCPAGEIAAER